MSMKIALAGIGKIARDQHIPSIDASADWNLAATVSRHQTINGIEAFEDLQTMLAARPDIEVVSLCMPPVPRFDCAAEAIRAERHVMLEKPPGATLSECHALAAMARDAGVSIFATWHSREAAQVEAAKAWLKNKRLRSLKIDWREDVRRWHPGQDWIWQAGGLGVFDPGINALSILTEILPDPIHLTEAVLEFPENRETPIAAALKFRHPHDAVVKAIFDWRKDGDQVWTIEVETEDGVLSLADGGAKLAIDGVWKTNRSDTSNPLHGEYPRLYAKMADLVRSGKSEMDLSPMAHVADAFLLGRRITVAPFHE